MAIKHQFTLAEVADIAKEYIDKNKLSNTNFLETHDNIIGLLDKIGIIKTIDTEFTDPLPEMNGEYMEYGLTVEEYFQDLILTIPYDREAKGVLAFYQPTYRPVAYSYDFGRRVLPISIENDNISKAVNNAQQLANITAIQYKRITDSVTAFEYQLKRQLIGQVIDLVMSSYSDATSYTAGMEVSDGKTYTDGTDVYVAVKTGSPESLSEAVSDGYLIKYGIVEYVDKPTDRDSGNAFVLACKRIGEVARDISEGNSLNGNTIGTASLSCLLVQGVLPELEVYTLAQTYHMDQLGTGVNLKVIRDFGSTTSGAFCVMFDSRCMLLHNTYKEMRENVNGLGDFLNLFYHLRYTGYFSRNGFIHIFVDSSYKPEPTSKTSTLSTKGVKTAKTVTEPTAE